MYLWDLARERRDCFVYESLYVEHRNSTTYTRENGPGIIKAQFGFQSNLLTLLRAATGLKKQYNKAACPSSIMSKTTPTLHAYGYLAKTLNPPISMPLYRYA